MKTCCICKKEKEALEFYKNKRSSDGYNYSCKKCTLVKQKVYCEKNKEKKSAYAKAYREKNKEKVKIAHKKWVKENRDKVLVYSRSFYKRNTEKYADDQRRYISENREKRNEVCRINSAKRRAKKLKATPIWSDLDKIKEFYINCPNGYEVDHIIPLRGKTVCGLHILSNLQYLTRKENMKKGNRI